jgi:ligand-binding sensor protein
MNEATMEPKAKIDPNLEFPFDVDTISKLLRSLLGDTDIRLSIVDLGGNSIFDQGQMSQFCANAQNAPEVQDICMRCTRRGISVVNQTRQPYTYRCAMGMAATIFPLMLDEQQVAAYLIFSGYRMEEAVMKRLPTYSASLDLARDYPRIEAQRENSPYYPNARMEEILHLLSITVSYLMKVNAHTKMLMELQSKSLDLLTSANIREQQEKKVNQVKLRNLNYRMWDAFQFDAMECISRIAEEEGAPRTAGLISDLSLHIRKGLRPGVVTTLGQEVEELDSHVRLLDAMYGKRIQFSTYVSPGYNPEAEIVQIPLASMTRLIMGGPLGELPPDGRLEISVQQTGRMVEVTFMENVSHFSPALVRAVNHLQLKSYGDDWRNFQTVMEELSSNCGSDFRFELTSKEELGTKLILLIPVNEGNE